MKLYRDRKAARLAAQQQPAPEADKPKPAPKKAAKKASTKKA